MEKHHDLELREYQRLHPADLADKLQRLSTEEARTILLELPRPLAAATLGELERDEAIALLEALGTDSLVELFRELPPDYVADLAAELEPAKRRAVLMGLSPVQKGQVAALLRYPPDSAGGAMSNRYLAVHANQTVQQCQEMLRTRPGQRPEDISYLYATDDLMRLVGVVPFRDLVFTSPERRVADVMRREVTALPVDADQEEIARRFEHYHYLALPVIDGQGRLVGIVKASDALEIASAEATEDMQLMVGLSGEERALAPWRKSVPRRLPWLYLNLATALLAAMVVNLFESTIAQWTALAVFLPVIAGQGGNAGMQTLTVIIRDLALGELKAGDGWRALGKELMLALVNGVAVGIAVGVIGFMWKGSITLGVVAALAMVLSQLSAAAAGVAVPFGLKALRIDPALAASIFVTTVTDVAGFFFFLGLAFLAIRWFGV